MTEAEKLSMVRKLKELTEGDQFMLLVAEVEGDKLTVHSVGWCHPEVLGEFDNYWTLKIKPCL